jgi:hypothetical protein
MINSKSIIIVDLNYKLFSAIQNQSLEIFGVSQNNNLVSAVKFCREI